MDCFLSASPAALVVPHIVLLMGYVVVQSFKHVSALGRPPETLIPARREILSGLTSESRVIADEGGVRVLLHPRVTRLGRLSRQGWHLEVRTVPPLPKSVTIIPREIRNRPQVIEDVNRWHAADAVLADAGSVQGAMADALLMCPASVRPALVRWLQNGGALSDGALWLSSSTVPHGVGAPRYEDELHGAIELARSLADAAGRNVRDALIETARNDPSETMRGAALIQLRAMRDGDPAVQRVFTDMLKGKSDSQVESALPYVAADAVEELDALIAARSRKQALRLAAFDRLVELAPRDPRTVQRLAQMVSDPDVVYSGPALRTAVKLALPEARAWVLEAAQSLSDLRRALAFSLLPDLWEPDDEKVLLRTLYSEPESVADAAVNALARRGTPRAFPILSDLSDDETYSDELRSAARKAIHAIRERHGSSGAGTFALVDAPAGEAGAISIAHDARGHR